MKQMGEGTMRRTRRIGVITGLIVVAGVLAGCSSSSDSSTGGDAEFAGDAAQAESRVDGAAAPEEGAAAGAAAGAVAVADNRSLIVTGSLYITVEDPLTAADQAASIVKRAGGRVDARNETAPQERDGGSALLTLRIPLNDLDDVVDDLRALGTVDHFATDSRDVTTEVTDLDAKISTLRDSTARIQGLLLDAKNLSDIITLENELDSRQAELQSLEAQQRGLRDQVSMSTIDLSLTTEPIEVVEEDDSPQTFWDGLVSGWNGLVAFISVALVIVGVLLPWAALAALIVVAVVVMIRARRSRAHCGAQAAAATAPEANSVPMQNPVPGPPAP